MYHIMGHGHDVCVHGPLRLWAERGLIHVEDARDNSYLTMSLRTCLERINAHVEMLKNSREQMRRTGFMDVAEYNRIQTMVELMTEVCQKAKAQGEPFNDEAVRDAKRRLPTSVLMPAGAAIM